MKHSQYQYSPCSHGTTLTLLSFFLSYSYVSVLCHFRKPICRRLMYVRLKVGSWEWLKCTGSWCASNRHQQIYIPVHLPLEPAHVKPSSQAGRRALTLPQTLKRCQVLRKLRSRALDEGMEQWAGRSWGCSGMGMADFFLELRKLKLKVEFESNKKLHWQLLISVPDILTYTIISS